MKELLINQSIDRRERNIIILKQDKTMVR